MHTERQQEIIAAALELINKKGIQGLTIKNLSKKIGITEPAIYRHFENKIQILITILDVFAQSSSRLFQDEMLNDSNAIDKIKHLFQNHFKAFTDMPSLTSVVFSEEIFRNETILADKISEIIERNNKILIAIITEGQRNNEIRVDVEAKNLTIMVMGTLRLFIKKWQFSAFSFNLHTEGEKILQMIYNLIKAQ